MDPFAKAFIKASMIYFLLGTIIGVDVALYPGHSAVLTSAHVHFNLLGWMSMMIYGVGYHILPRFSGKTLYSPKLATWQLWLANIGLLGMGLGFIYRYYSTSGQWVLAFFGIIEAISVFLFVYNLFKTIK
jgi:cytochrome c oxidase cbb3-type subunit 1